MTFHCCEEHILFDDAVLSKNITGLNLFDLSADWKQKLGLIQLEIEN